MQLVSFCSTVLFAAGALACTAQSDVSFFHVFHNAELDAVIVLEQTDEVVGRAWYAAGLDSHADPVENMDFVLDYYNPDHIPFSFHLPEYNTDVQLEIYSVSFYDSPINKRQCKELVVAINGFDPTVFGFLGMVEGSFVASDAYGNAIPALPQHLTGEALVVQFLGDQNFTNDKNQRLQMLSERGKITGLQIDGKKIPARFDLESGTFLNVQYKGKTAVGTFSYDDNCHILFSLMDIQTGTVLGEFYYDTSLPGF